MLEEKVSLKTKLSYGCGDIFAGGSFLLIALLFMYFLTDVVGLKPELAGLIVMLGRIWDAVTDPLMGTISDRTKSRFGRRRIYFLAGIIPIFFTFAGLWQSWGFTTQTGLFFYYLVMYVAFSTAFTMVQIPYVALMPEITSSYNERASVAGFRLMFSAVSAIIAGVVPMLIINSFPKSPAGVHSKSGYALMGLVFGIFYALPWLFVFSGTKENPLGVTDHKSKNPVKEVLSLFKNKAFRNHAGLFIGSQTAVDFLSALFLYYISSVLKKQAQYSTIMAALLIVPVIMMPIYVRIARKYQKTTPMHFGLIIWIIAMLSTLLVSENNWVMVYIIAAFAGIGTSASVFVPWTILPEVTDVDEIISGHRREGIYGGFSTFLRKVAGGIAIALLGILLGWAGYLPPEELAAQNLVNQSAETIFNLRLMFAVIPTIFIIIALFFSFKYNVNSRRHAILMAEINRLKSGGSKTIVDAETRSVCEELTGLKYEQLWDAT